MIDPEFKEGKKYYIPELDGLRFFAFLFVFLHNAGDVLTNSFLQKISDYGWMGVDLFFCLSAFLITKLIIQEHHKTGRIDVKSFYIRRALRIWPLYFFYIFIGILYAYLAQLSHEKVFLTLTSLATFSYNFAYYVLLPSPIVIFIHLWSISYEWQFYLIIPWAIKKLLSLSTTEKLRLFGVLLFLGNLVRVFFIYEKIKHPTIYFLPFTHFESIIFGLIIGLGLTDHYHRKVNASLFLALGVLFLFLVFLMPNNQVIAWHLPLTYICSGAGMGCILLSILSVTPTKLNDLLGYRPIVALGRISYGLYIFHALGLSITSRIFYWALKIPHDQFKNYHYQFLILALCITLILSIASYYYMERRFLELKSGFASIK